MGFKTLIFLAPVGSALRHSPPQAECILGLRSGSEPSDLDQDLEVVSIGPAGSRINRDYA